MAEQQETQLLRRCVRDLLALSALSAYWNHADFAGVAEGLAEVMLRSVPASFVFVRVNGLTSACRHEVVLTESGAVDGARVEEVSQRLAPYLHPGDAPPPTISNPLGEGQLRVAVNPIGFEGDSGYVAIGSPQSQFPTDTDLLLLAVATNQAAVVLQHRRAEAVLQESRERFARFMQHLPGLAWIKDVQGRYVYANDAALRAFRKTREELYDRTDEEIFPPETAAQFKANDWRAIEESAVQVIETLEHDDGLLHHSLVSKFAIPTGGSEAGLVGGVAIDITDRLRAEAALREADRRKDEFLATLAHELRNPLAPIRYGLELLRMAGDNAGVMEQARCMMDRQLQHMVRLIDDLLDVSRITRGKLQLRKEWTDLATIINSAVEATRPLIESSGHELTVSCPPEPIYLEADPMRLAQVFSNLLNNAAKYTDAGGQISLSVERQGDQVMVKVQDTGIGLSPEMLPRIFEMFMQVDRSLEKRHGGLGIGLTLVQKLVAMHGGSVEAHSDGPGRGSDFVVRLPAAATHLDGAPRDLSSLPASPYIRRRLLVADDNTDSAESLALLLRLSGNEVLTARDGQEAVQAAATFRPDVVFLDIGMPKLNGYEAARLIRDEPWGKAVTLVALTGWGQPEDKRRASDVGFDHHLTKPVDPATLEKLLANLRAPSI